jgi:hypothetical protein
MRIQPASWRGKDGMTSPLGIRNGRAGLGGSAYNDIAAQFLTPFLAEELT